MTAVLQVRDLAVSFRTRATRIPAVRGVDFDLRRGETLALVGESGAGKSTIANALLGLQPTDKGEATLRGVDLLSLSTRGWQEKRRHIQIVFQNPMESLTPRMRAGALVAEPLRLLVGLGRKAADQRAAELLDEVELDAEYLKKFPHQLSGGEAQRVAIARALAVRPEVIVLDEPTSALDVAVRGGILDLLRRLQHEHEMAYLLITHDLSSVRRLAHAIAVIYGGTILEYGSAKTILARPAHAYTRALLAAALTTSDADDSLAEDLRLAPGGSIPERGCTLAPRCPWARGSCLEDKELSPVRGDVVVRCDVDEALPPKLGAAVAVSERR